MVYKVLISYLCYFAGERAFGRSFRRSRMNINRLVVFLTNILCHTSRCISRFIWCFTVNFDFIPQIPYWYLHDIKKTIVTGTQAWNGNRVTKIYRLPSWFTEEGKFSPGSMHRTWWASAIYWWFSQRKFCLPPVYHKPSFPITKWFVTSAIEIACVESMPNIGIASLWAWYCLEWRCSSSTDVKTLIQEKSQILGNYFVRRTPLLSRRERVYPDKRHYDWEGAALTYHLCIWSQNL